MPKKDFSGILNDCAPANSKAYKIYITVSVFNLGCYFSIINFKAVV